MIFTAISWEGQAIIDDMMMYVVNKTNMPSWLTKASPQIDMSLPCDTHCLDSDSNQSVLSPSYYMLSGEPVNTNFIVLASTVGSKPRSTALEVRIPTTTLPSELFGPYTVKPV